jgi:hypothetical protein
MRKAYLMMALALCLMLWGLLAVLLTWWLATLVMLGAAWLFWIEVAPLLHYWQPQRRSGWQRNALRWTRRDFSDLETGERYDYHHRERRD